MKRPERINEIISMIEEADPKCEGVVMELIGWICRLESNLKTSEYLPSRYLQDLGRSSRRYGKSWFQGTCSDKKLPEEFGNTFQEDCGRAIRRLRESNPEMGSIDYLKLREMGSAEYLKLYEQKFKYEERYKQEYLGDFIPPDMSSIDSKSTATEQLMDGYAKHIEKLWEDFEKRMVVPPEMLYSEEKASTEVMMMIEENKEPTGWSMSNGWVYDGGDMELVTSPPVDLKSECYRRAFESGSRVHLRSGELVQVNEIGMSFCNHRNCPITTVTFSNGEEIIIEEK